MYKESLFWKNFRRKLRMEPMIKEGFEIDIQIQIEELEPKTAPTGGETVLPLNPLFVRFR